MQIASLPPYFIDRVSRVRKEEVWIQFSPTPGKVCSSHQATR